MLSLVRILQEPVKSLRSSLNAPFALCHSIFTQPFAAILECALFIERLLLYEFLRKLMSLSSFLFLDFFNALVVSVAVFFLDLLPQRLELRNVVILFIQAHCKVIARRVYIHAERTVVERIFIERFYGFECIYERLHLLKLVRIRFKELRPKFGHLAPKRIKRTAFLGKPYLSEVLPSELIIAPVIVGNLFFLLLAEFYFRALGIFTQRTVLFGHIGVQHCALFKHRLGNLRSPRDNFIISYAVVHIGKCFKDIFEVLRQRFGIILTAVFLEHFFRKPAYCPLIKLFSVYSEAPLEFSLVFAQSFVLLHELLVLLLYCRSAFERITNIRISSVKKTDIVCCRFKLSIFEEDIALDIFAFSSAVKIENYSVVAAVIFYKITVQ